MSRRRCPSCVAHVLHLCGLLVTALISVGWQGVASAQPDVPSALQDFYSGRRFCSLARVTAVVAQPAGAEIRLEIDPRWHATLLRKPDVRRRWYGIHCPLPQDPLWRDLGENYDLFISAQPHAVDAFRLSCRQFNAHRLRAWRAIDGATLPQPGTDSGRR
ncbi:MAG: hypothetical protein KDJ27_12830 [Gammaproteobacteria bacterium]|nr:hypothetical protein [Gammaproteobacteria bacterium]